jgi:hypothetical protein
MHTLSSERELQAVSGGIGRPLTGVELAAAIREALAAFVTPASSFTPTF